MEQAKMDASAWSNTLQRTIEISGEVYEKTYQRRAGFMAYAQQVVDMVKAQLRNTASYYKGMAPAYTDC